MAQVAAKSLLQKPTFRFGFTLGIIVGVINLLPRYQVSLVGKVIGGTIFFGLAGLAVGFLLNLTFPRGRIAGPARSKVTFGLTLAALAMLWLQSIAASGYDRHDIAEHSASVLIAIALLCWRRGVAVNRG